MNTVTGTGPAIYQRDRLQLRSSRRPQDRIQVRLSDEKNYLALWIGYADDECEGADYQLHEIWPTYQKNAAIEAAVDLGRKLFPAEFL